MVHNKKIAPSNPNLLDFEHVKGFGICKTEKKPEIMTSEKNMRMEELESGQ